MRRFPCIIIVLPVLLGCCQSEVGKMEYGALKEGIPWQHKDPAKDSISGISLEKAYEELLISKEGTEVVVAVLDNQVSLTHEDLEQQIYINKREVPFNDKDDDQNGFIDDVHGWNFLGYGRYQYEKYASYNYIRTIRAYKNRFEGKDSSNIVEGDRKDFDKYMEAVELQQKKAKDVKFMGISQKARELFNEFKVVFSDRIPGHQDYTLAQLDSLVTRNEEEEMLIKKMKRYISVGYTFNYTYGDDEVILREVYTLNNPHYNERANIGDDPFDYEIPSYGNGNTHAPDHVWHGTQVSGIIAATRNNGLGVRGVSNKIRIMPIVVYPEYGDLNIKDLAFAIRYAVDNGAKIINLSGGEDYILNEELLFSALKYAEVNDVLFVTSAGNDAIDLDDPSIFKFPNDRFMNRDSVENLIRVGASTKNLDSTIYAQFSSYGKERVDFFAPGDLMKTTDPRIERYRDNQGTSLSAALTSGVAALILSHYPDLGAKQLKKILMKSGIPYEFDVVTRNKDTIPFSDLSKSGKVLNAYNALKMAEEISTQK